MTSPLRILVLGLMLGASAAPSIAQQLDTPNFTLPDAKKTKAARPSATASAAKPAGTARERRPGELEGFDSGVKAPIKAKSRRPADAVGERAVPDGGLPLPAERSNDSGAPPISIDKNGNMGGMFRF